MKKIWHWFATIPQDKLLHSYVSLILFVIFYQVLLLLDCYDYMAYIFAFLLVAFVGGVKEILDAFKPKKTNELKDWIADLGGAALGVILMLL